MDLFLGNYEVEASEGVTKPSPLRQERDWKFYAVSYMLKWTELILNCVSPRGANCATRDSVDSGSYATVQVLFIQRRLV